MKAAQSGSIENIKALIGFAYAEHFESRTPGPIEPKRVVDVDLIKSVTKAAGRGKIVVEREKKAEEDGEEEEEESIGMKMRMKQGIGGMEMTIQKGKLISYTALTLAVECGKGEAVRVLLDLGADPNKSTGAAKRKLAPIHIAAKFGFLDIMKTLILHGAKIRTKDRHGLTAFHYAAKYNQLHCLSWLAAHCVPDADIIDSSGNTALQYACAEGFILVVKYLVEVLKVDVTIKNSWGMTALELALLRQQTGVLDYLISSTKADLNFRDNSGATVLMKFCAENMTDDPCKCMVPVRFLLSQSGIDVLAVDISGCNALHYVATQRSGVSAKYDELVKRLLVMGLNIDSKSTCGKTPLHIAACTSSGSGNDALIASLIKYGADISDLRLDNNRNIVQHFASVSADQSSLTIMKVVESSSSRKLLQLMMLHRDEDGMNGLHILLLQCLNNRSSSSKPISWQIFECLVGENFKADINSEVTKRKIHGKAACNCKTKDTYHTKSCPLFPYTEHGKFRPLNFAMKYGDNEDIERILSYKPDLNYVDCSGMYPLHHLVKGGNIDLIPLFLELGALTDLLPECGETRDNSYADYPILVLAALCCIDSVLPLVEAGACVLAAAPDGRNVLHHIVSSYSNFHKRISITEKLLPMVDKIDEVDADGNSYLHHAVAGVELGSNISIEMISLLLLKGANPNLPNLKGQTPLHFAFLSNNSTSSQFSDPIEVVSILTNVMNKDFIKAPDAYHGFTPLHLSAMRGGSVTSMHLIFHGCDIDSLDNQGNTPLTLAINGNHQSCVLMLIEKGASIDRSVIYPIFRTEPAVSKPYIESNNNESRYKWLPLIEKPLSSPPEVHSSNLILYKVIGYEWQGVTFKLVDLLGEPFVPLEAAIRLKKFNLAITLLLKFGKKVKPIDCNNKGQTLVHCLALASKKDEELQKRLLDLLIKFHHSVSAKDSSFKCTPLHYSCLLKKLDVSKPLVKPNTVNCKDNFGRTPICALYWNSCPEDNFVRYLVEEGASLENTCDFNLQESDHPLFDYEFNSKQSDYFTQFSVRYTLLIKAIIENKPKTVDLLIELGADINTPDNRGITPLMYAAKLNMPTMFTKILASATPDAFRVKSDEGKTVLHYAILSYPQAHLSNPTVFNKSVAFLTNNKNDTLSGVIRIGDSHGETILDLCKKHSFYLKILGIAEEQDTLTTNDIEYMDLDCSEKDFMTDCKRYFEEVHDLAARFEPGKLAKPDSCLSLSEDECEVYQDEKGVFYDMLMTKIDIKSRWCSLYNFYKLQLIRNKGKDIFLLLTRWGRIGDEGQHQETPFPTLAECKAEYMKVFKAKTKNDWNNLENFVPQPLKYRLVSREIRYYDQYKNIEYDLREKEIPEHFDNTIFSVLLEACDLKNIGKFMEDNFQLNATRLAFGFIKPENVAKAENILKKIKEQVTKMDQFDSDFSDPKNVENYTETSQDIYDLTIEIYHLIPQTGHSVTSIEPLNSMDDIKFWENMLANIRDMEVVNRILAASQLKKQDIHPVQYIYSCLNCKIESLESNSVLCQYLIRNIYAATGNCDMIKGIFKLTPMSCDTRPQGERVLMYHGISTGTLLSILRRGLKHAPFGKTHGNIYGDGIYLADNIKKSLSYASGTDSRFVLVVSVYLGKIYTNISNRSGDVPADVDTVWTVGTQQQNKAYDVVLEGNTKMSMGKFMKIKRKSFVLHDPKNTANYSHGTKHNYYKIKNFVFGGEKHQNIEKKDSDTKGIMEKWDFRCLPDYNEFVIKDFNNIKLEYLIQIR